MYIHMYIFFSGVVRRLRSLHTKGECYCYLQAHDIQGVDWPRKTQHRGGVGGWGRDQPPTQHWRGVGRVLSPTLSEINKINIKKSFRYYDPVPHELGFFLFSSCADCGQFCLQLQKKNDATCLILSLSKQRHIFFTLIHSPGQTPTPTLQKYCSCKMFVHHQKTN